MNKMKKMALLLLLAAASNGAKAQNEVIRLQAGEAFTLRSRVEAVGTGLPPKYQWYRDGSPIEGATSPGYTIPAGQAVGSNVQFKRAAYTDGCAERMFTNTISITWCNLLIDGVCWADANVAQPGTFAARPDMYTELYQWNQPGKAWSPSTPAAGVAADGWNPTISTSAWTSTPCPEGWRLPTLAEIQALNNTTGNVNNLRGYWASAGARGNAVAGRFYGNGTAASNPANPAATALPAGVSVCSLPGTMVGCIFIPAVGYRNGTNGALAAQGNNGSIWSSTQNSAINGHRLSFDSGNSDTGASDKAYGRAIRCVQ